MYDILQLNDMLVPELLNIAEQLKITGVKKLEKQESKLLDMKKDFFSQQNGAKREIIIFSSYKKHLQTSET